MENSRIRNTIQRFKVRIVVLERFFVVVAVVVCFCFLTVLSFTVDFHQQSLGLLIYLPAMEVSM